MHFGRINLHKVARLLRPATRHCAKLLRASLIFVAIGGAATGGPLEDAVVAYQSGDYATALRLWHPIAEQGDVDAQFHLGVMYESGQGVLRNDAEAIKWYRKAADQGDAVAQFNLGIMYTKGEGVSQNATEAALWYHLAADHGLAGAQFNLGMMYVEGQGVSQDYVQAHMWLNPSSLATSNFWERSTEHNRRLPRPCRIQNDADVRSEAEAVCTRSLSLRRLSPTKSRLLH